MANKLLRIKQLPFYACVAGAWWLLWVANNFFNRYETFFATSLNDLWLSVYLLIANFTFFEYALPLMRKANQNVFLKMLRVVILIAVHLFLISVGLYAWMQLGISLDIYTQFRQVSLTPGGVFNHMVEFSTYLAEKGIASTVFFGIAFLLYNNFKLQLITQKQKLEMREAELSFLKSQTNPHFLFNTLNNIYVLATEKSELAPESILRLSQILRFMLYETSAKFISIEKELEIIYDYLALEKLRYDDTLAINFKSEVDDPKIPLRPLLLIPLIENAFKHGASEAVGDPFVDINLTVAAGKLKLVVRNSVEKISDHPVKENIGLGNLKRQLHLLYSDYNLSIDHAENTFTATLQINLTSNVEDKVYNN